MEILSTERLAFHIWTLLDIEDAVVLWSDPQVMALLDRRGGLNKPQIEERLAIEIERQEKFGMQYWKVID